jgi:polar amino acid transport system substrate-binding protein
MAPLLGPRKGLTQYAVRAAAVLLVAAGGASCAGTPDLPADAGALTGAQQVIKPGTLTVCTSLPYEPFEFSKGGKTVGFDIDLAAEVASRLRLQPVFLNEDFDAIASGELLNKGTCDLAAAGLTITGDRARVLDFSSPYFNAAQALVVKAASGAASLADLEGVGIAVQGGTTGELYVTDNAPASSHVVDFKDPSEMADAVASGQVGAAVYDNTVVGDVVAAHPDLRVAAEFDTGEQYGMAVKKNANVDLLRTVNDVLSTLRSSGGYNDIYRTWFGTAPQS